MKPAHLAAAAGAVLWALLALPVTRAALEATMSWQMLLQLPLLAAAGWALAQALPRAVVARIAPWNRHGIAGLLLASLVGLLWMLPRMMDLAVDEPAAALAKFLSVPLLVGAAAAVSWPQAGFVVRAVVIVEIIAMCLRLGWLYLISPERLCSNYLLADQQRLGQYLIALGLVVMLVCAWRLIWGHVEVEPAGDNPAPER